MGVSTEEGLSFWLNLNNCVPTPPLPNINHNLLSGKGRGKSAVSQILTLFLHSSLFWGSTWNFRLNFTLVHFLRITKLRKIVEVSFSFMLISQLMNLIYQFPQHARPHQFKLMQSLKWNGCYNMSRWFFVDWVFLLGRKLVWKSTFSVKEKDRVEIIVKNL